MASISLGLGLALAGGIGAAGSVTSGILGSNAAETAAGDQEQSANNAIAFQNQIWQQEQNNIAPYLSAGSTGISQLMAALDSGKFGAGSLPAVPTAPGAFTGTFSAPTLQQAEQEPGYQFSLQQGLKGVSEAAAAGGGAVSGGTIKAADNYAQNLGETDYQNVFNNALSTYGTALQGYQANLQGYGAQLSGYQTAEGAQQQEFNQMLAPAQLGENAAAGINSQGTAVSQNVGNLMTQLGNAQAAGTIGSTNAITNGISGGTNSILQSILLSALLGGGAGAGGSAPNVTPAQLSSLGITTPAASMAPIATGTPLTYTVPPPDYNFAGPMYGEGPG